MTKENSKLAPDDSQASSAVSTIAPDQRGDSPMKYSYTVKGWEKFQHYKNRNPPWIKLYRELLDDPAWHNLDPLAAKYLPLIWLIASHHDGKLPEIEKLAFRLRITTAVCSKVCSNLSHWLEQDASKTLADCKHVAPESCPEGEGEGEGETERDMKKTGFVPPTRDEVKSYAESIGFGFIDVEAFFDYYEADGWRDNKGNKIRSWKRCVGTWKNNAKAKGITAETARSISNPDDDEDLLAFGRREAARANAAEPERIAEDRNR